MRHLAVARAAFELALLIAVIVLAVRLRAVSSPRHEGVVTCVSTRQKVVALTFDDGPHPTFTPEILAALDKYGVKATFFMIGRRMEQYPQLVRQVLARGHAIGNHTYTHPHNIEADTPAQIIRELDMCEQVIERMTGRRASLFRPPLGLVNGTVAAIAQDEGYRTILWTVSADHHDAPTPKAMAERVLRRVRPGAIILAHDGTFRTRWKDAAAVPLIIQALRRQGYAFVTVPELLKIGARRRAAPTG